MIFILRISKYEISVRNVDKPKSFFKILNHDIAFKIIRRHSGDRVCNNPRRLLRMAGYKRPELEIAIAQKVNRPVDEIFPKHKQRVY